MSHKEIDARMRFLKASAYEYASSAPTTSAHLMSQINTEGVGEESLLEKDSSNAICKSCGTISIPGRTSRSTIAEKQKPMGGQRSKSKIERKRKVPSPRIKHIRTECLICYRYDEKRLDQLAHKGSRAPRATVSSTAIEYISPSTILQQPSGPTTNKNGGKKRAKARKQGGLQAMLEKAKASTASSSGFGLDLLDMMKQG